MIEEDYKPVYDEVNPENLIGVTIEKDGTLKDVEDVFDYDKDSETIQKEIEEFNKNGETEEAKESFGFDDFAEEETDNENVENVISSDEEVVEDKGEIEDYFDSAEFVIFVTEIIIVFGTNFYLKYNKLDKITIKDFNKTAGQQKLLVKSWAKVLHKNNAKVSPEMELLFALGSAYGMKISSIVDSQKAKKYDELMKAQKKGTSTKRMRVEPKDEAVYDDSFTPSFDVDFENVEEVATSHEEYNRKEERKHDKKEKEVKKPSKGLIDLS